MKIDPYLSPCIKLKSKCIKDINTKLYTLNLIEKKAGKYLELLVTVGPPNWGDPTQISGWRTPKETRETDLMQRHEAV